MVSPRTADVAATSVTLITTVGACGEIVRWVGTGSGEIFFFFLLFLINPSGNRCQFVVGMFVVFANAFFSSFFFFFTITEIKTLKKVLHLNTQQHKAHNTQSLSLIVSIRISDLSAAFNGMKSRNVLVN